MIIDTPEGKIVIEGRRLDQRNVPATEAQEVIGKGSKQSPIANVTVGYPDFADEAKRNTQRAHVTLIRASILGDILVEFWQGKLSQDEIFRPLKSQRYVEDPYQESKELTRLR